MKRILKKAAAFAFVLILAASGVMLGGCGENGDTPGSFSKKTNEVENPVIKKPAPPKKEEQPKKDSGHSGGGTVTTPVVEPIPGMEEKAPEVLGAAKGPEGRTGDDSFLFYSFAVFATSILALILHTIRRMKRR